MKRGSSLTYTRCCFTNSSANSEKEERFIRSDLCPLGSNFIVSFAKQRQDKVELKGKIMRR